MPNSSGDLAFCMSYLNKQQDRNCADGLRARQFGFALLDPPATRAAAARLLENMDALDRALLDRTRQEDIDLHRRAGIMALEQLRAAMPWSGFAENSGRT